MIRRYKYLQRIRDKKTGKTYLYFRRGHFRVRLAADFGTLRFEKEYQNACNGGAIPPSPGTFGAVLIAYKTSPEFAELAARTRADYEGVFDYLRPMMDVQLDEIRPSSVLKIRDKAATTMNWAFANKMLGVMSRVFNWGRPRDLTASNPVEKVPHIKRPKDKPPANRPWTDDELGVVLARAKPHLAMAVALGAYSGLRLADVLALPWSAYDDRTLQFHQAKTGDLVWLPVHRTLKNILDRAPRVSTIIVTGEQGRPYTRDGFSATFRRFLAALREEGLVGDRLTFHGLRHTIATRLADAGADLETIAAITGHRSTAMASHYSKTANRRKRAERGIQLLEQNEA